jgi:FixJ family two-component response regulator
MEYSAMNTPYQKKIVFHVDDEPGLRRIVTQTLQEFDFHVVFFETARACIHAVEENHKCDLIITDTFLSDMSGITLLSKIREIRPLMPVLFVSYFGTIPLAVQAMKLGAIDFIRIEKPVEPSALKSLIYRSLEDCSFFSHENESSLTVQEARILQMVADGRSNSEIAYLLECSVRTVECHRNRIMHKLKVSNLASLVKKAIALKLTSIIGTQEPCEPLPKYIQTE